MKMAEGAVDSKASDDTGNDHDGRDVRDVTNFRRRGRRGRRDRFEARQPSDVVHSEQAPRYPFFG
jgi:hypothetical protein